MDVLKVYDAQMAAYLKKMNPISLPLLSWDVHMNNLNKSSKLYRDALDINKITNKLFVDVDIIDELKNNQKVIVITDENLNIEFVSSNTTLMTGYLPSEILGKTPKMFQGKDTDKNINKKIRKHVKAHEFFEATILNYKKDSTVYDCHIKGYPIFDKKGACVKFVAIENAA